MLAPPNTCVSESWNGSRNSSMIAPHNSSMSASAPIIAQQHRELVAAEPGDCVARPNQPPQPAAEIADQLVAGEMPKRVVDLLEMIEVDQQQRHWRARPGTVSNAACSRSASNARLGRPVRAS